MVAGAVAAQSRGGMAGPNGAGVVPTAACWRQMTRGVASLDGDGSEIRPPRHPRPDGDGLLPLPMGS
jgi:hypothetical protein